MEEKDKVEIISEEMVEKVINNINEAEEKVPTAEGNGPDINKVREVIKSLAGCTSYTVVSIIATSLLLLPAGAIMAVLDISKQALKSKVFSAFVSMIGEKCSDCKDAGAPEITEE